MLVTIDDLERILDGKILQSVNDAADTRLDKRCNFKELAEFINPAFVQHVGVFRKDLSLDTTVKNSLKRLEEKGLIKSSIITGEYEPVNLSPSPKDQAELEILNPPTVIAILAEAIINMGKENQVLRERLTKLEEKFEIKGEEAPNDTSIEISTISTSQLKEK